MQKHASAKAALSVSDAETGADANTSEGANAESAGAVFADADDVQMQTFQLQKQSRCTVARL